MTRKIVRPKTAEKLRKRILTLGDRADSLRNRLYEVDRQREESERDYLRARGWDVVRAHWHSYLCQKPKGTVWYGLYKALQMQIRKDVRAARKARSST